MAIIRHSTLPYFPNPFQEFARVQREMDRVLKDIMGKAPSLMSSGVFPALNVSEDAENIYVHAELAGFKPEDIEVSVVGNTLTLSGERKPDEAENVSYHRRERSYGSFQKALTLPHAVNAEAVQATCTDGVLKLVLPKHEDAKPKKITVKTE